MPRDDLAPALALFILCAGYYAAIALVILLLIWIAQ